MYIYYDSKTGNVKRFVSKIERSLNSRGIKDFKIIKIEDGFTAENKGHFITFTTGFGKVPNKTERFFKIKENAEKILSISSSGNMNWGPLFAKARDTVSKKYNVPAFMKFELSGTNEEVEKFIDKILEEKEMRNG